MLNSVKAYRVIVIMYARIVLCLVLATFAFASQPRIKANPEPHRRGNDLRVDINGREYYFSGDASLKWRESQTECEMMNMTLIRLDIWRWSSGYRPAAGTMWTWASTNESFTDMNWGPGQPSNGNTVEDCANFLVFFGGWDDDECEEWLLSYACEQIDP
ncbi:hypothetical protein B566_EDAN008707 [Ephemera danica]|nr:hypothetical protein B566_EDAN008707 [Ephemera danica]